MDDVDLCNLACDQISARAVISSVTPPAPPNSLSAQVAFRTYPLQRDAIFRAAHWNSARKQIALTLLKAAQGTPENPSGTAFPIPPIPFRYEYAYPPDCLLMRFLIEQAPNQPATSTPLMTNINANYYLGVRTSIPFVVATDLDSNGNTIKVILTNACNPQGVYTARITDVDLWDAHLQNAVVGACAAWFCAPLTGDDKKKQLAIQMVAQLLNQARISDGNEAITSSDHIPDWMQIRDVGGWGGFGAPNEGWVPVARWVGWCAPGGLSY